MSPSQATQQTVAMEGGISSQEGEEEERKSYEEEVNRIYEENKARMVEATARIQAKLDADYEEASLVAISTLAWPDLVAGLQAGELSTKQVLAAYQHAAIQVQERTNCIVDWVASAEEVAEVLDDVPAEERGPLHGVPVSVKEAYYVTGTYSTGGMKKYARNMLDEDADVVKMLRELGAVPFCITNVPQAMISQQCSNRIYGTSTNPRGQNRECGGSSGGEGSLVGGGGSMLGIGNDIGGSLRNPAAFCGCFTLKPTDNRGLSQHGVLNPTYARPIGVTPVGGFLARSAAALEAVYRIVWGDQANSTQSPWNEGSYRTRPKIGYFDRDCLYEPAYGCKRAVTDAVSKLQEMGYDTVKIKPPNITLTLDFFMGFITAERETDKFEVALRKEVIDSSLMGSLYNIINHPNPFNTADKLSQGNHNREKYRREYMKEVTEQGVEVILCPAQLMPAPPTEVMGSFQPAILPYIPWNVMNFPAGVAPVTEWSQEDEDKMDDYPTREPQEQLIKDYCKNAHGLPLGVQVSFNQIFTNSVVSHARVGTHFNME